MVLLKMKETAEAYLGHEIKDAVVTVPAVSRIYLNSNLIQIMHRNLNLAHYPFLKYSSHICSTSMIRKDKRLRTLVSYLA